MTDIKVPSLSNKYRITTTFASADSTRQVHIISARTFMDAVIKFNTSSVFDGYELISISVGERT